jgi:hypothetical protein
LNARMMSLSPGPVQYTMAMTTINLTRQWEDLTPMKLIRQMNQMLLMRQMNRLTPLPGQSSLADLTPVDPKGTTPMPMAKAETVTTGKTSLMVAQKQRRTAKMVSAYDGLVVRAQSTSRTIVVHTVFIDDVSFEMDELISVLIDHDDYVMTNAKEIMVLQKYGIVDRPGHLGMGSSMTRGPNADDLLLNLQKMRRELDGEEDIP